MKIEGMFREFFAFLFLSVQGFPQGFPASKTIRTDTVPDACLKTSSAQVRGIFPDAIFWEFKKS